MKEIMKKTKKKKIKIKILKNMKVGQMPQSKIALMKKKKKR
jgi:hypothetical protein